MKKFIKILCIIVCAALVLGMGYLAVAFLGNPISWMLSKSNAQTYLNTHFPGSDFQITNTGYNFKTGSYFFNVHSPSSQDSYFTLYFDGLGRYEYDSYGAVTGGSNTFSRISRAYRDLVDSKLYEGNDVINCGIAYGDIKTADFEVFTYTTDTGETEYYRMDKDYGLDISTLELDKEYDILAFGRDYGRICLYVHDPEVSVPQAAELLLEAKEYLDQHNIPFHGIDFHLCEPRNESGQMVGEQIDLYDFLYSDIYEEGLIDRVQEHWDAAQEHHAIQDAETAKLVAQAMAKE